ncbi:MAG: O-antigen ligase family protein [bacterium]
MTGVGPATPVMASRPQKWDVLLICTAVYILTAVGRLHQLYAPVEALKPLIIFAALGLFSFFADKTASRKLKLLQDPTSKAARFIIAWATIGVPFGIYHTNSLFYLREEAYPVAALFLLVAASVRDLHDVRRLVFVYGGGIVYLALTAMARKHGGMRLGSASYDANDLGMVLVSAISIGIWALTRAKGFRPKVFAGVSLVVLAIATVETDSRGAFLGLVAVIGYTLFFLDGVKKSWRVGAAAAVVVFMMYAATGSYWNRMRTIFVQEQGQEDYNKTSLTGRIEIWKRGMGYMFTHPIFGIGVDNFMSMEGRSDIIVERQARGEGTKWSVAHSSWVQIGAEMGIPGLAALVVFYFGGLVRLKRLSRMARARAAPDLLKEGAAIGGALMGVLIGLMIAGSFITQGFGYAVWAGAGLVAGLLKVMNMQGFDTGKKVAINRTARRAPVTTESQPTPGLAR